MKSDTKKFALKVLMLIFAFVLMGCNQSKGKTEGQGGKPEKIKFMVNVGTKLEDGSLEWGKEFERLTGIKLEEWNGPLPNNEYYTKIDLAFSTGESPDVFNIGDGRLPFYVGQGAVADLTELYENSEALSKIDKKIMDSLRINGKIYGIPFEAGGGTVTMVRQDWLEACGLEPPTNYDEFLNMLRAFKKKYPDSIPYTAPSLYKKQAEIYVREFYQDATPEFTKVNGKWVDGLLEPNMVAALKRLQDAYGEGLIDQEIITNTTSTCRDRWYAGKVGVFTYWAGMWAMNLEKRVQVNVPDAKVLQLPSIKETKYLQRIPAVTVISSQCKNIPGVFKHFVEYIHDGKEGQLLFERGVEGLHWKQEGDNLVSLPKISKPKETVDKAFIFPLLRVTPLTYTDKNYEYDPRVTSSLEILKSDDTFMMMTPLSKTYTKIASDLLALKEAIIGDIVMGKMSVEDGLAKYARDSKDLRVDEVLAEMNANQ